MRRVGCVAFRAGIAVSRTDAVGVRRGWLSLGRVRVGHGCGYLVRRCCKQVLRCLGLPRGNSGVVLPRRGVVRGCGDVIPRNHIVILRSCVAAPRRPYLVRGGGFVECRNCPVAVDDASLYTEAVSEGDEAGTFSIDTLS